MRLRNVNPLGDVVVSGVGEVKAGAEFEVPAALGKRLLEQPTNYEPVKGATEGDKP